MPVNPEAALAPWQIFGGLIVAALIVIFSGVKLTKDGDELGRLLKLSRSWVGVVVLAMMTSLPELVVTASAQWVANSPGIVLGNVCGSNLFNLAILAIIDIYEGPGALTSKVSRRMIKPTLAGMAIMGVAVGGFLLGGGNEAKTITSFLAAWWPSVGIVLVYAFVALKPEREEQAPIVAEGKEDAPCEPEGSLAKTGLRFACFALLLVVGGVILIKMANALIKTPLQFGETTIKLQESMVASVGVALVSSLPELVVCLTAVRMGAVELALGNILGSNMFNMILLPVGQSLRPFDAFWNKAELTHGMILGVAIVLCMVLTVGIKQREKKSLLRMGWDTIVVALLAGGAFLVVLKMGVQL